LGHSTDILSYEDILLPSATLAKPLLGKVYESADLHYADVNKQLYEHDHTEVTELGLTRLCDIQISEILLYISIFH
jgi:hypothetical protein